MSSQSGVPPVQSQSQGAQSSPGAHAGHAHVHAPPPPVVPPSLGAPPEQSHSTGGHGAFAGQAMGLTHAQLPALPPDA
jgi:hypothetical protein